MMAAHCAVDIAPVPESVSRSMSTSSAGSRKRLKCAARRNSSRCSRVVQRIGSTLLMRNGSMTVLVSMEIPFAVHEQPQAIFAVSLGKRNDCGHMILKRRGYFLGGAPSHRVMGQFVGLAVLFAVDMLDGKLDCACQLAAGPVQGVKTRAMTGILAHHLLNHDLGVGVNY